MPRAVFVTITGAQGAGKTHFLEKVLVPALRASGQSFRVIDGGSVTAVSPGNLPHVEVLATNSPALAVKHQQVSGE